MTKTILISGGTGMIGSALSNLLLASGHNIIHFTRNPEKYQRKNTRRDRVTYAGWDIKNQEYDRSAIEKADAIVHLAGAGVVAKPWTPAYKQEILESRTQSSALLIKGLRETPNRVTTIVSQSAVGYYGADVMEGHAFTEDEPAAPDFLGQTCVAWEQSIEPVLELGKRLVKFRTGIVLGKKGGVLAEFKKPLKLRVAAVLGEGSQMVSWIHEEDECRLFAYAIENEQLHGVFNAVAPQPVNNETLTISLARAMYGNGFIKVHVPEIVLKLILGTRSIEVLKSATISSQKIIDAGFEFKYARVDQALKTLV